MTDRRHLIVRSSSEQRLRKGKRKIGLELTTLVRMEHRSGDPNVRKEAEASRDYPAGKQAPQLCASRPDDRRM